jgi:hypothetical protein
MDSIVDKNYAEQIQVLDFVKELIMEDKEK